MSSRETDTATEIRKIKIASTFDSQSNTNHIPKYYGSHGNQPQHVRIDTIQSYGNQSILNSGRNANSFLAVSEY